MFFTFFKLCKWYQIAQSITYPFVIQQWRVWLRNRSAIYSSVLHNSSGRILIQHVSFCFLMCIGNQWTVFCTTCLKWVKKYNLYFTNWGIYILRWPPLKVHGRYFNDRFNTIIWKNPWEKSLLLPLAKFIPWSFQDCLQLILNLYGE